MWKCGIIILIHNNLISSHNSHALKKFTRFDLEAILCVVFSTRTAFATSKGLRWRADRLWLIMHILNGLSTCFKTVKKVALKFKASQHTADTKEFVLQQMANGVLFFFWTEMTAYRCHFRYLAKLTVSLTCFQRTWEVKTKHFSYFLFYNSGVKDWE